jgi:hypothetical protein
MPLNWSTEKVEYFKNNPDSLWVKYYKDTPEEYEDLNAETKSLVFGTMAVCMNSINWNKSAEFFARWSVLEKFDNFFLYSVYKEGMVLEKVYLTPQAVIKHIGLSTNATSKTTREWITHLYNSYVREGKHEGIARKDIQKAYDEAINKFNDHIANALINQSSTKE